MQMFIKDPGEALDYMVDWSAEMARVSDTISTVAWTVPNGLTKGASSNTTTTATVWLSAGEDGQTYDVVCRITTAAARIYERTMRIRVRQQ